MGIYSERLTSAVKINLRKTWTYSSEKKRKAVFWGFYGILWFYNFFQVQSYFAK